MLDSKHPGLSHARQCNLLDINRSSVHYRPRSIRMQDLEIMKLIVDEQYMKTPVYGSRSIRDHLDKHQGYKVNRKRVQRLMRLMGLEAIYPKPKTSNPDISYWDNFQKS